MFYSPKLEKKNKKITNDNISNENSNLQKENYLYDLIFKPQNNKVNFSSFKYLRTVEKLENAVYIKSLEVDTYSRIVISERYKKYFLNSNHKNLIVLVN